LQKYFGGVFELPLPRNAQKRTKKKVKKKKGSDGGWVGLGFSKCTGGSVDFFSKYLYKQSMSKTFFSKISTKNFDVSFSSNFFVLSRFRVFLSDGSSKTLQKTFYKKNRVEKFLQKIRPKIQNRLFSIFF
jgi:hypothetical protein